MNNEQIKTKVASCAYKLLNEKGHIAPVDLFMKMQILSKKDYEDWRMGRIPYLEKACKVNLSKMSCIMNELRSYGSKNKLKASFTAYKKWGKGPQKDLRFSKTGAINIEKAYSTHLVGEKPDDGIQIMQYEKSCGVIIYRDSNDTIEFLVVRSKKNGHWGFPKGHVEEGETEHETAKREVLEETGLEISVNNEFRESICYSPAKHVSKEVVFFISKYSHGNVLVQKEEILDYKWLSYNIALEVLDFESYREVLAKVKAFISKC